MRPGPERGHESGFDPLGDLGGPDAACVAMRRRELLGDRRDAVIGAQRDDVLVAAD